MLLSYHDKDFYSFFDNRGLSTIGSVDVNISEEQAVELALQYIKTYSYRTVGGSEMTGFNISMADITCTLCAYPYEPLVLGACWNVQLPFEEFVGSTWALTVFVSAGSGEIYKCTPRAVGSTNLLEETNTSSVQNSNLWIISGAVVAVVAVAVAVLLVSKRGNVRRMWGN